MGRNSERLYNDISYSSNYVQIGGDLFMKNSMKKIMTRLFLVLPPLVGIISFGIDKAYVAEDTVSITLNKKAVDTQPAEIQNTGEAMREFDQYDAVKGAEFIDYNITTAFWQAYNTAPNGKTAPTEVEQKAALKSNLPNKLF